MKVDKVLKSGITILQYASYSPNKTIDSTTSGIPVSVSQILFSNPGFVEIKTIAVAIDSCSSMAAMSVDSEPHV
jgi:hypothetical protein